MIEQLIRRRPRLVTRGPLHTNALLDRVLSARGIETARELEFGLSDLPMPETLPDLERAVTRLHKALIDGERILIVGDYDCDGATSTALAMLGLRALGASHVEYLVPNRFEFGYGLSPEIVEVAARRQPQLIVTVDNGVASVAGVAMARMHAIDVVITDHHLPPAVLPEAVAIVNPNLEGASFPSRAVAGVGVIFYLLLALRAFLQRAGWFVQRNMPPPNLAELLDLVAIGTVADVVPLDRVNRILVEQGLRRIRAGRTRPGVLALISIAGRDAARLTTSDIGFAIGPRLNAAGRLADIGTGIRCLLASTDAEAAALAQQLDALNRERQRIELAMRIEADQLVAEALRALPDGQSRPSGLCLFERHWHQGVIGILAGRIKETLHVPTMVFAEADAGCLKGSGRSIPGVHLRDVLDCIASGYPGVIDRFGGHAMAAGLTLAADRLEIFRAAFTEVIHQQLGGLLPERTWLTDGPLAAADFSLDNALLLRDVMPWGQSFPEPSFDGRFVVHATSRVKERHLRLRVAPQDGGPMLSVIAFNEPLELEPGASIELVYRLDVNEFRGQMNLQLRALFIQPVSAVEVPSTRCTLRGA